MAAADAMTAIAERARSRWQLPPRSVKGGEGQYISRAFRKMHLEVLDRPPARTYIGMKTVRQRHDGCCIEIDDEEKRDESATG